MEDPESRGDDLLGIDLDGYVLSLGPILRVSLHDL